jgi:glycosyltransferase involved in cell wall biosynthesis
MIVVAWLWNSNGMASWCWEAAHALFEAGREVLLVCSSRVVLPGEPEVPTVAFDPPGSSESSNLAAKLGRAYGRLSSRSSGFVGLLHARLLKMGHKPSCYLLNCSELEDPSVAVRQYVVGWSYPPGAVGYIRKVPLYMRRLAFLPAIRSAMSTIGWYGKDWRAYRSATGVLAVSNRLDRSLRGRGVRSSVVHPGTRLLDREMGAKDGDGIRMVIAAVDLDEPRKRVEWMLTALGDLGCHGDLVLIGSASEALRAVAVRTGLRCVFPGKLRRIEAQRRLLEGDVFLFGSLLDDWGYVLVEAMAGGLAVVAPDLSPFDEIVGEDGNLYPPSDAAIFRQRVKALAGSDICDMRAKAIQRARRLFSRPAFSSALMAAISDIRM